MTDVIGILEGADPIAVRVSEAARVDLVDGRLTPPGGVWGGAGLDEKRVGHEGGTPSFFPGVGGFGEHQPLTAPCVTPSMTQRCVNR